MSRQDMNELFESFLTNTSSSYFKKVETIEDSNGRGAITYTDLLNELNRRPKAECQNKEIINAFKTMNEKNSGDHLEVKKVVDLPDSTLNTLYKEAGSYLFFFYKGKKLKDELSLNKLKSNLLPVYIGETQTIHKRYVEHLKRLREERHNIEQIGMHNGCSWSEHLYFTYVPFNDYENAQLAESIFLNQFDFAANKKNNGDYRITVLDDPNHDWTPWNMQDLLDLKTKDEGWEIL